MAFPTIFHEDSDADDEYERSMTSPQLPTDSEASPTDSDPPSAEHTPTTYGNFGDERLPKGIVTDWTAEDCAEYISSLGLPQYYELFLGAFIWFSHIDILGRLGKKRSSS